MKKNPETKKANAPLPTKTKVLIGVVVLLALILIGLVAAIIVFNNRQAEAPAPTEPSVETEAPTEATEAPTEPEETTEPAPVPIDWMVELQEQNPDTVYWIKIEGTKLDYPVMYTPDEPERYLHKDFEGNYEAGGLPFLEDTCSVFPNEESTNLLIYGHNMVDGSQFRTMMDYKKQEFWEEHPYITLTDLYNERTFEIMAVFYDRVYYQSETNVFKFYRFIDPATEEEFNEGIAYFKENALYDTGVTAEFGDQLLMLCTCSYHTKLGRFVMVAREVVEEPAVAAQG